MSIKEQIEQVELAVRAELPVLAAELLKMSNTGSHDGGRFRELARELSDVHPETRLDIVMGMVKRTSMEAVVEQAAQQAQRDGGRTDTLPRPSASPDDELTEDDVAKLIGEAYIRSGKGEKDRPLYLLDLARRIAIAINKPKMAERCEELAYGVRRGE